MEIISEKKHQWLKVIDVLKKNGIIVFPTDTAYGLGANFLSPAAVKKVFKVKQRPVDKKIALVASDLKQIKKYFILNKEELTLAKKYWPGPLTLILKQKGGNKKIGVRVPQSKIAREIARRFGKPITATSANISGQTTPYSISAVLKQYKNKKNKPDIIIDGGKLKKVKPSTILEIIKKKSKRDPFKIKIIRKGPVNLCMD